MKDIYFKFAEKLISHKSEVIEEFIAENPHRDSKETIHVCLNLLHFIENRYFMRELFKEPVDNPTSIFACCDSLEPIPKDLSIESIEQLIEDYQRRLKTIMCEIQKGGDDLKINRLSTKRSSYRTFIHELEQAKARSTDFC